MRLVSVNVAQPWLVQWKDDLVETGIFKQPVLGPVAVLLGAPYRDHGLVLTGLGRAGDAEPILRRAVDLEPRHQTPGHVRIARAEGALGACLVERGLWAEAEPLLLSALERLTEAREAGPYPPLAWHALVTLYTLTGRPADAARYQSPLPVK
jgi:hypothetical protein